MCNETGPDIRPSEMLNRLSGYIADLERENELLKRMNSTLQQKIVDMQASKADDE